MTNYDKAKAILTKSPEKYFPGGENKSGDYFFSRRPGDKSPSAHIVPGSDAVKDFGDPDFRGSVLDVYSELNGLTVPEAVARLVPESAQLPAKTPAAAPPMMPIPPEAINSLKEKIRSSRRGKASGGWRYDNAEGGWMFSVIRFDGPGGKKEIIPYYYTMDNHWKEGVPVKDSRPLFNLPLLSRFPHYPVLITEGEKCASVEVKGWVVVTWSSGSSSVAKTDWSPLAKRKVTIWPDADEPGLKAALQIKNRLPHAEILDIQDQPKGWDIADAAAEERDLVEFIIACPRLEYKKQPGKNPHPFTCLGYDRGKYHFLDSERVQYEIIKGKFSPSGVTQLAPAIYWQAVHTSLTDSGKLNMQKIQEIIMEMQKESGMYDPTNIRGSGVWMDRGRVIINEGSSIVSMDGEKIPLASFDGEAHYIRSDVRFGDLSGVEASSEEGRILAELFDAQGFARPVGAVASMGWALIAPFGGLLPWRPHLWISGRRGTGKSFVLDSIISELCGPFAHQGSGKDTEAGIRRTLNMDARPVILDEMEPKKSARDNITKIVDLSRNASGDGSGNITMASGDSGTAKFVIRSCFCFASVNTPDEGAAVGSRIIYAEIKAPADDRAKISRSRELYAKAMHDPGSYRRRTFRALPRILKDIDFLRDNLPNIIGDQRKADVFAPVLSAAWAAMSDESINTAQGIEWFSGLLDDVLSDETPEDEDRVIEHLMSYQIRTDDNKNRTIAEMLLLAEQRDPGLEWARDTLSRIGFKFEDYKNGDGKFHIGLAIASAADTIENILKDTPYYHGYDAQIKRSALCINAHEKGKQVSMRIGRKRCRILDWAKFRAKYLEDGKAERQGELYDGN